MESSIVQMAHDGDYRLVVSPEISALVSTTVVVAIVPTRMSDKA